ncbi:MAG: copper chaperone PCu(A)C [Pseudonocardiaceae bacterium]
MRQQIARAALAVGVAIAMAGCGAGQITQTDAHQPAVNGTHGVAGMLRLSDVALAFPEGETKYYPAGSDVPLTLHIANRGDSGDVLTAVQSPAATSVAISGDKEIVAHHALSVRAEETPEAGSDSAIGSEEIGVASILLEGLKQDLRPGQTIEVTLTFREAGRITLRVPIAAPSDPRTAEPHEGEQAGEGGH